MPPLKAKVCLKRFDSLHPIVSPLKGVDTAASIAGGLARVRYAMSAACLRSDSRVEGMVIEVFRRETYVSRTAIASQIL